MDGAQASCRVSVERYSRSRTVCLERKTHNFPNRTPWNTEARAGDSPVCERGFVLLGYVLEYVGTREIPAEPGPTMVQGSIRAVFDSEPVP